MKQKKHFTLEILAWYQINARDLPWRREVCAYHTWVSEIMCQQTRVDAVIPYYLNFLSVFPTIEDLANASSIALTKAWEGLGYYRRVHNMQACAKQCVERYAGQLPSTYQELLTLQGIGPYSAGAIASIAYKERVPAVDGNVLRVFSRLLCNNEDISKEKTKKHYAEMIMEYLPKDKAGDFNQAIMEIGALICIPNGAPKCEQCPLAKHCEAYKRDEVLLYPNKPSKKLRKMEQKTIVVVACGQEIALHKRPTQGLLANMYEFDTLENHQTKDQVLDHFSTNYNIINIQELTDAKHIFSHIEWDMKGYLLQVEALSPGDIVANMEDIEHRFAIPTAFKEYKKASFVYLKKEV